MSWTEISFRMLWPVLGPSGCLPLCASSTSSSPWLSFQRQRAKLWNRLKQLSGEHQAPKSPTLWLTDQKQSQASCFWNNFFLQETVITQKFFLSSKLINTTSFNLTWTIFFSLYVKYFAGHYSMGLYFLLCFEKKIWSILCRSEYFLEKTLF